MDPGQGFLSANVQMVFVPRQRYSDSICFRLDPGLRIHSLAAQELKHYSFKQSGGGWLVLYLQDPVESHDQLHISMSYSGTLKSAESVQTKPAEAIERNSAEDLQGKDLAVPQGKNSMVLQLDSSVCWYPGNEDIHPFTFRITLSTPESWQIVKPDAAEGRHGKWLIRSEVPGNQMNIYFARKQ